MGVPFTVLLQPHCRDRERTGESRGRGGGGGGRNANGGTSQSGWLPCEPESKHTPHG